jgi:hypothetical protein
VPRYLVERTFPGGLAISADRAGAEAFGRVVTRNAEIGVTRLPSYLSEDKQTMVSVYEGPSRTRSARRRRSTTCLSTASPRSGCSIRTSTGKPERSKR